MSLRQLAAEGRRRASLPVLSPSVDDEPARELEAPPESPAPAVVPPSSPAGTPTEPAASPGRGTRRPARAGGTLDSLLAQLVSEAPRVSLDAPPAPASPAPASLEPAPVDASPPPPASSSRAWWRPFAAVAGLLVVTIVGAYGVQIARGLAAPARLPDGTRAPAPDGFDAFLASIPPGEKVLL